MAICWWYAYGSGFWEPNMWLGGLPKVESNLCYQYGDSNQGLETWPVAHFGLVFAWSNVTLFWYINAKTKLTTISLITDTPKFTQWNFQVVGSHDIDYSSANKKFAVLRRNRSDPLSRAMGRLVPLPAAIPSSDETCIVDPTGVQCYAMGCIGELRAGSRSAGYERFGTGNLAPLAILVPIPKPATHSKGASNQHPHCTVYIWMYRVGSHWIAVKIHVCTGQQVNYQTSLL